MIHKHRDRWFTLLFPLSCTVAVGYWMLGFPTGRHGVDARDVFADIAMHFVPLVFVVVELLVLPHDYAQSRGMTVYEVCLVTFYALTYVAWNAICYGINDIYPYKWEGEGMAGNPSAEWGIVLAFISTMIIFYFLGRYVSQRYWGKQSHNSNMEGPMFIGPDPDDDPEQVDSTMEPSSIARAAAAATLGVDQDITAQQREELLHAHRMAEEHKRLMQAHTKAPPTKSGAISSVV